MRRIALVLLLVAGCSGDSKKPSAEPSDDGAAAVTPIAPVRFDTPEQRCASDEDCTAAYALYEQDGACCRGCTTLATTTAWQAAADEQCQAMGSENCPLKKCRALAPVACIEGVCAVQPADP